MAILITIIICILIMISLLSVYIIFKRYYEDNSYYVIKIKPLKYDGGRTFIQKMAFFISNCKSIPKVKGKHNLILDVTNTGKKTYFRLIVPEIYLKDYHKIFSSNYKDFEVKLGGKYTEKEFISKYKGGIVFRTDSDTPFLKEELLEEKIGENIKSIITGVTAGSFQVMLNFDAKTETFADATEIEDVKIDNTIATNNINFVKDIGASFRFLSLKDDFIETTMPGLVGGILNLGGKFGNITKFNKGGRTRIKNLSFKKSFLDFFYRVFYGRNFRLSHYSPSDEMFFNAKEISYIFNFVPSDNADVLQYKSLSPVDAIKYQDNLEEQYGEGSLTNIALFDYPGVKDKYFKLHEKTLRRHVWQIGKTGMGKSTLIKSFIFDDIAKGRGFCLIEPNGDLAEEILDVIPEERKDDVIYLDPSVYLGRVCLSIFSFLRELRHFQQEYEIDQHQKSKELGSEHELYHMETEDKFMSMIVNMMKAVSIGGSDFWGPRMDKIMKEVGTATLKYELSEISDISYYLNIPKYRKAFINAIENEDLKESLYNFENKPEKDREEAFQPVRNRFDVFLSDTMKNIFSGKPKFSLKNAMDDGKIIIMRLPKGTMGDGNASLLGSMMVALFWALAQTRISTPEEERQDFTLYIDEFQNFVTDSFSQMLEEARKYKLRLVLANQFTKQIKNKNSSVFDSLKGNIGTFVALGLGTDDAQVLAPYFGIDATNMVNIPPYHGYVKCEEYSPTPFNIVTKQVEKDPNKNYPGKTAIKNLSYSKYGLDSEEIEVEDEFVISKKQVFRALMSLKTYDKALLGKKLRIKKISFDKLIEELFFEGILTMNDDGSVSIEKDKINLDDKGYFDFVFKDHVNKEKPYVSLGTYFREYKRLPTFGFSMDSYNKEKSELKETPKTESPQKEEKLDINDLFDDFTDGLNTDIDSLNEEKLEVKSNDISTQYSYDIKNSDLEKTFGELVVELGFKKYEDFEKINHNNNLAITENTVIIKKHLGRTIHIKK